jgi:hypothetical protein
LAFLARRGMPTAARGIHREHVEAVIAAEPERTVPSPAATRYRSLQQLFGWLDEEGEIDRSPMAKTRPPKIPGKPVPVLPDEDVRRLLAFRATQPHMRTAVMCAPSRHQHRPRGGQAFRNNRSSQRMMINARRWGAGLLPGARSPREAGASCVPRKNPTGPHPGTPLPTRIPWTKRHSAVRWLIYSR